MDCIICAGVQEGDGGLYTCQVKSPTGQTAASAWVTVLSAPTGEGGPAPAAAPPDLLDFPASPGQILGQEQHGQVQVSCRSSRKALAPRKPKLSLCCSDDFFPQRLKIVVFQQVCLSGQMVIGMNSKICFHLDGVLAHGKGAQPPQGLGRLEALLTAGVCLANGTRLPGPQVEGLVLPVLVELSQVLLLFLVDTMWTPTMYWRTTRTLEGLETAPVGDLGRTQLSELCR